MSCKADHTYGCGVSRILPPNNTCGCKYNHLDNSGQREQKGAGSVKVRVTAPRVRERHRPGEYADRVLGRLAGSILQLAYAVASTIWPIHMDAKVAEDSQTWLQVTHPKRKGEP